MKFCDKSIRVAKYRQKLHASKVKLRHIIADLQRLELVAMNDHEQYRKSLVQLEEEVIDAKTYCTNNPAEKNIPQLVIQNDWADVDIRNGLEKINQTELDLNMWKVIFYKLKHI